MKRTLYLVIRESIQNSKKHAFASEVLIDFKIKHNTFVLSIKDNGKGFNISSLKFGLGLKNQKKRIEELNGNFTINSVPNSGTTTNIEIPLTA
ncbi:sensor histidine kinase [Polaribacter sp. KT25b]|uniref:sensor histidine kinase n=1 Tax=Polaribacter sp. KT25b TaxID=1855336 RepID=UPI0034A5AB3C